MRIGYYVQGDADEAVVRGLVKRWCPQAELAMGRFRGMSKESFRREIRKALLDLRDHHACSVLVVLTDADANRWQDVKRDEWQRIPEDCRDICIFGVADRNVECWLSLDRSALASELRCTTDAIPADDPSGFVKRRFGLGQRDQDREDAKQKIEDFVTRCRMGVWIDSSSSFAAFYDDVRRLAAQMECAVPNERDPSSSFREKKRRHRSRRQDRK